MYRKFFFLAGLVLASTAQAQTPDRTIMKHIAVATPSAPAGTAAAGNASAVFLPRRGSWGCHQQRMGRSRVRGGPEPRSLRGPPSSCRLGCCSHQGAILFTRRSGTPLDVGRYRISERANGADEILALVLTGSPTRPTGAFRGQSGWLVVTAASDRSLTGRFQLDAIGFRAAEPEREDRPVNVTGSFSATAASSSFRVCEDAE